MRGLVQSHEPPTKTMTKKIECKITDCDKVAKTRAICSGHYAPVRIKVKRGDFSWQQLEELGITEAPTTAAGMYKASFDKMFNKKNKDIE